MKKIYILVVFCFVFSNIYSYNLDPKYQNKVTQPFRSDGFGAQYQSLIFSVIYAELNGHHFVYTPFEEMEHNYNNDSAYLQKQEILINFIDNFDVVQNQQLVYKPERCSQICYNFFDNNVDLCANSNALKKIKRIFRENKSKSDYLDPAQFNIAVHIRRPNPHDSRPEGTTVPNQIYVKVINELRRVYASNNPIFHIYSQGNINTFKKYFRGEDIVLHIDESLEKTFCSMVFADILVTGTSSLSYVAAMLSNSTIYYMPFWHPPLSNWIRINEPFKY